MGNTNTQQNDIENIEISKSNMYRRDTKTEWTQSMIKQYEAELQRELERQTKLQSKNKNKNNIFSCCMVIERARERDTETEIEIEIEIQRQREREKERESEDDPKNNPNTIKIIDVDLNVNDDDDSTHDLNSAVVDTTNAFLELLQLDTMSKHLEEMRDRRMFLEKAAHDKDLPEEERQIAAWITDTYLSKSPTTNYPQSILQNIMKKKGNNNKKKKKKNDMPMIKHRILSNQELKEIISMNGINIDITINDTVITLLSQINEWNFSVFEFVEECNHSSLSVLMITICRSRQITEKLNIPEDALIKYMNLVDINYLDNPYHNDIHAADVLLNMFYFMKSSIFVDNIDILDSFSILLAASVHDIGHPGHGNSFEINTESELAIRYNDQSVLENMHICLCWSLLRENESNILINMNRYQIKRLRMVLIDSVLATDMSQHSVHSETLEKLVEKYENRKTIDLKFSNEFLPIALHTADLGNICKETRYYNEWVDRLMNEFFNQGDKERNLGIKPISFLCDRFKVNIHSGQVGFINFVMRPWFIKFGRLLSEDSHNTLFLTLLNENLKYMQERANQTKDAKEEIKKHSLINEINNNDDDEIKDIVHPLPTSKPKIIDIETPDIEITNSRTSKSYSIVAMSFPEMRSKLLEWSTNAKENREKKENFEID